MLFHIILFSFYIILFYIILFSFYIILFYTILYHIFYFLFFISFIFLFIHFFHFFFIFFILFYFIYLCFLFYFLFYFILFYFILFYILFYFIDGNLDVALLLPSIPVGEKPTKKASQAYHKQSFSGCKVSYSVTVEAALTAKIYITVAACVSRWSISQVPTETGLGG